jgi:hypothetical protein
MRLLGSKVPARIAAGAVALAVPLSMGVMPAHAAAPHADVNLKQNSSDTAETFAGLACNDGVTVLDTSFYRVYNLAQYGASNGVKISSVSVKAETAEGTGSIPGSVAVYAVDPGFDIETTPLPAALATTNVNYLTGGNGGTTVGAVNATVPAGKNLVIEASVETGTDDQWFFMAANHQPEVASAYLESAPCGANTPTLIDDLDPSLAGTSMVFYASGKTTDCTTAEAATTAAETAAAAANAKVPAAAAAKAAADSKVKKAKAKLKKAKKSGDAAKIKKAKKKLKKAKAAAKAANAALAAVQGAAATANAAAAAATAAANTKCAQPALPPTEPQPRATGGKHVSLKAGTSLTR